MSRAGSVGPVPTWEDVIEIGLRLPEVEVGTSFGTPALRVRGKGMCRLRSDPDALVMRVSDLGEREALLQGQPDAFFATPHYDGYPYVLVRLDAVDPAELAELIEMAWRIRAPKRLVAAYEPGKERDASAMPILASVMPGVAGGILAVLSLLSGWVGQRRQARGRSY